MSSALRDSRLRTLLLLIVVLGGVAACFVLRRGPSDQALLDDAQAAMNSSRYEEAQRLAREVLERRPKSVHARQIAFDAAVRLDDGEAMLRHFRVMVRGSRSHAVADLLEAGDRSVASGRLSRAERFFKAVLEFDKGHVVANDRVASVLALQGRSGECWPFVAELIRQSRCTPGHLLFLSFQQMDYKLASFAAAAKTVSDDGGTLLARAVNMLRQNKGAAARDLLKKAVSNDSSLQEAWVRLGQSWIDAGDDVQFTEWFAEVPEEFKNSPGVWKLRGLRAVQEGNARAAVRCYWEACRKATNDLTCNAELARLLGSLGEAQQGKAFEARAALLRKLDNASRQIDDDRDLPGPMEAAAAVCEQLGRHWEAAGWWFLASQRTRDHRQARAHITGLQAVLKSNPARQIASLNPTARIDLSRFPLPASRQRRVAAKSAAGVDATATNIAFRDRAREVGLRFRYENGMRPDVGMRMYEFTGGGIGVLDFDRDGWPDIAFTQGGTLMPAPGPKNDGDRLFRNLGGRRFEDVTDSTGFGSKRYGQGIAAGDYDNDGFPDVLVANIGENRLYCNNGDGTFTDVTESCGMNGDRWTASCLIADLNGDGLPDLYEVNYLTGREEFKKVCHWTQDGSRKPPNCSPDRFLAEQDRLYLNLGNGRFQDVTETSGIAVPNGKGLGIVAADFNGSGKLGLFVANDGVANFYFLRTATGGPMFVERAVPSGLAFDRDGASQACMGVAIDDADGNGLPDLFVTNFYRQSNTLYVQQTPHQFLDDTRPAGLRSASYLMLGFGTQFLDADLDGRPDLVLTNGHVTDVSDTGVPFRMRPQFFRNVGGGRFRELRDLSPGSYFERKAVGRALARIDWDRDGREEFAVVHLDSPVALLRNETRTVGRFLAIELAGTNGSRDAIGTRVVLKCGNRRWVKQLTAGDGYQAGNHRRIVCGLGTATRIDQVTVEWISGARDVFTNLPANSEVLLIEGRPRSFPLPR